MQPGGVHEQMAAQGRGFRPADLHLDPRPPGARGDDRAQERHQRAGRLGLALQGQHVGVAVDDAGRRRDQRGGAGQRSVPARAPRPRTARASLRPRSPRRGALMPASLASSSAEVATISLPQLRCGTPRSRQKCVQRPPAGDAEPRHQAAGGVVDAGVDHLAVARGRFGADRLRGFQHDHLAPRLRQRARHREADHPGSHHHAIDLVHPVLPRPPSGRV